MRIFRDVLSIEVASPTTDLIAAGLLDSLALITLLVEIEQDLGVTIPLEVLDIESMRTLERMTAMVDELRSQNASQPAPEDPAVA